MDSVRSIPEATTYINRTKYSYSSNAPRLNSEITRTVNVICMVARSSWNRDANETGVRSLTWRNRNVTRPCHFPPIFHIFFKKFLASQSSLVYVCIYSCTMIWVERRGGGGCLKARFLKMVAAFGRRRIVGSQPLIVRCRTLWTRGVASLVPRLSRVPIRD